MLPTRSAAATPADTTNDFRRVLAGEGISNFGSMLSRLALPWLATLALDATPLQMALLLIADVAAGAAGALLLGTLVDRCPKRTVMIASRHRPRRAARRARGTGAGRTCSRSGCWRRRRR